MLTGTQVITASIRQRRSPAPRQPAQTPTAVVTATAAGYRGCSSQEHRHRHRHLSRFLGSSLHSQHGHLLLPVVHRFRLVAESDNRPVSPELRLEPHPIRLGHERLQSQSQEILSRIDRKKPSHQKMTFKSRCISQSSAPPFTTYSPYL